MPTKRKTTKPDKKGPKPPVEFKERARAALGENYEKALAAGLGVSLSTVYRWFSGDVPVPGYAVAVIELLELVSAGFRPERWMKE